MRGRATGPWTLWVLTVLAAALAVTAVTTPAIAQSCQVDDTVRLSAPDAEVYDGFGIAVAIDGDVAVVGARWVDDGSFFDTGAAYVYRRTASSWSFEALLDHPDPASYDNFGRSVAVSGDVILVGAEFGDGTGAFSDTGTVHVFRFDGTTWNEEAQLVASDAMYYDGFGVAVAVDGDAALVGARHGDGGGPFSDTGAAYVFRYDGSSWSEEAILAASDAAYGDLFGVSVALAGDLAAVGAEYGDGAGQYSDTGTAYVFRYDGASWSEEARLTASDAASYDGFGIAVDVDSDVGGARAAVGAYREDDDVTPIYDRGAAYVFHFDGAAWSEEQKLVAGDADHYDQFGASVALDGDWLAAGANYGNGVHPWDTGSIYVYHRLPALPAPWVEAGELVDPEARGGEELGIAVALAGDTVVGGAHYTSLSPNLFATGAALVFGPLSDCDADGVLDSCQADCNFNGVYDACEIAAGTVEDENENDIPDVCECGCLDLFFLIDNTGTMTSAIATIQAELPQFVERARTRAVDDLRLGLIRFGDLVDVMHDLTFDVEDVLDSLANVGGVNGGDYPEPSDAALQELFEKDVDLACLEDATAQYPEELDPAIDFRDECLKIAVLLTDALPTGCEDGPPSAADLANAAEQAQNAADAGVQIFAVYPPNPVDFVNGDIHGDPLPTAVQIREIMQNYADVSGGIFAEVETDGTGLLDAVLEGLDRCVDCNENGVSDFTDIAVGTSPDEDGNTRPDECEDGACCVAECEGEGDPAAVLLACLTGEVPFTLSCLETTRALCEDLNTTDPLVFGTFQGIDTDCDTAACGGACCLVDGCVSSLDEADCDARGGNYRGDGTSCEDPGICSTGGCCYNGGYSCDEEISFAVCETEYEGSWLGPGALCGQHDNCLGACCTLVDGQAGCQQTTRYTCEHILAGHFSGEGSDCEAEDFVGCHGACCESAEACFVTTYEECTQAELTFAAPGTACTQEDACPDYGGCWVSGTCQVTSHAHCDLLSGSYLGPGRPCGANCAFPPGSCPGDFDLDGDVDEDDLTWLDDHEYLWETCVYGIGDCVCDRFDLCQSQEYDPDCTRAVMEEHMGTSCP